MTRFNRDLLAIVTMIAWLVSSCPANAEAPVEQTLGTPVTLKEGDPAPKLAPGQWIRGEPVGAFENGKVYVVDFWATWCGSCTASLPHLSKLQRQYKDVIFVGQDCAEANQAAVYQFITAMGDQINVHIASDDMDGCKRGKMLERWMDASGEDGIPTAFVIDRTGRIAWIGHPFDLDEVLRNLVAGVFNPAKHAAHRQIKHELDRRFQAAMRGQEFDGAIEFLDRSALAQPEIADFIATLKFNVLLRKKDYQIAWKLGESFPQIFKDDGQMLNELARMIWSCDVPETRGLDLAERLASRAVEVTRGEDGFVLLTLARVEFARGNIDKAIEIQTKALAKESRVGRKAMQANLLPSR